MVVFNRILNILVVILAIVIVVFSVRLYNIRAELRDRGDTLADTVVTATGELNKVKGGSLPPGEVLQEKVTNPTVAADVKSEKSGAEGSLGWRHWHNNKEEYNKFLNDFENHAKKVVTQRDKLADKIIELAATSKYGTEEFPQTKTPVLMNLVAKEESLNAEIADFNTFLTQSWERDKVMREKLEKLSELVDSDFTTSVESLKFPEGGDDGKGYTETADHVYKTVEAIMQLSDKRALALSQIVEALGAYAKVEKDQVRDANEGAVDTLIENIGHVVSEADQAKILREKVRQKEAEILAEKQRVAEAHQIIATKDTEIENLNQKLENKIQEYKDLLAKYQVLKNAGGNTQADKSFEGKIISVNYDWGIAIIDLGMVDKLPVGLQMTISREREFICKAKVTKVFKSYAVCDILSDHKQGEAIEGDKIFYLHQ